MSDRFTRFHPDLWLAAFNYEAISAITTVSEDHMRVDGHFRTRQDYIGVRFNTVDSWMHEAVRYPTNPDYRGTKLAVTITTTGPVLPYDSPDVQLAMTVRDMEEEGEGEEWWVSMGHHRPTKNFTDTFIFTGEQKTTHRWIMPGSQLLEWWDRDTHVWRTAELGTDYELDFVWGRIFTGEGSVPGLAECRITYQYCYGNRYVFDFDDLWQGTHPTNRVKVDPQVVGSVMLPVVPNFYETTDTGGFVATGRSDVFRVDFTDITVTGGDLGAKPAPLPKNRLGLAEGYDNETNKNPKRLIESMGLLGFGPNLTLYTGASHYYDKWAEAGKVCHSPRDMILDPTLGCNAAYKAWLRGLCRAMPDAGFNEIVISLAMENLQCPHEWKQLLYDGTPGQTGWEPPTSFYEPANEEVRAYMRTIAKQSLDIVIEEGLPPILQLGETWYWWQEFEPGHVEIKRRERSPAFYGQDTLRRHKEDTGRDMPIWPDIDIPRTPENEESLRCLRSYLGGLTTHMRSVADEYGGQCLFTVLFFPPSVIDYGRVSWVVQAANYPSEVWGPDTLDFIQIEDYDWVITDSASQPLAYDIAWEHLGFPYSRAEYWAGFVDFGLPEPVVWEHWRLIERAAQRALGKGFRAVVIWAGTQIRRDSWLPTPGVVIADAAPYPTINKRGSHG